MSIFIDKHELAERKDIINPNLLDKSKSFIMYIPLGDLDCGKFIKYSKSVAGSIYLSDAQSNPGIKEQRTAYFPCEPNTYYTQSLWLTSSAKLNEPENYQVAFISNQEKSNDTINPKLINLGNNHYKIVGSFYSGTNMTNFDIGYIKGFSKLLSADANIRFDALKIEKGTIATPWCPAWCPTYDDYAMKSDLDALKAEIEQLKQK